MDSQQPIKIFISYAHKDGAELAQRLLADLTRPGFDAWLDVPRLAGGDIWTSAIEEALDQAQVVLAGLTSALPVSIRRRCLPISQSEAEQLDWPIELRCNRERCCGQRAYSREESQVAVLSQAGHDRLHAGRPAHELGAPVAF